MVAITTLIAAAGLGLTVKGQRDASKARKRASSLEAQRARLENTRRRREQIRQLQANRANILSAGVFSGAQFSSAIEGSRSSATSTANSNILGLNQGQEIGANLSGAQSDLQTAQGISSLGGAVINNASTIGDIFSPVKKDPWENLRTVT